MDVSGDLFDMLLPMLSIYQEYVRNHHYSLQVLTECKGNANFATVLKRLEGKFSSPKFHEWAEEWTVFEFNYSETSMPRSKLRNLFDVSHASDPTIHYNAPWVVSTHAAWSCREKKFAKRTTAIRRSQQVISFSNLLPLRYLIPHKHFFLPPRHRQMHDEVSETENLRKNLAVERMIVEGCDILLDVNQVFVRQGSLVQVPPGRGRIRSRLASFKSERESVRQCFLFSNHMIIATR